jgi:hypothetical protein
MLNDLANKQILFVAPGFFGYGEEVKREMEKEGAQVDFLLDRPFKSFFMKGLTTLNRQTVMGIAKHYYQKKLLDYARTHYDLVFVINGQTLSPEILAQWRQLFPMAQFVLYVWDSINNRQTIQKNFEWFDYCFSFDKKDADFFGLYFQPLFFSRGFENPNMQLSSCYDVSFIGTAHSARYSVVSAVAQLLSKNIQFYKYLYLQAKWVYLYYKVTNPSFKSSRMNEFAFSPLNKEKVQQVFLQSKSILDIEHPLQTGLTIRSLEALGAKKKLITTNQNVVEYDFYNPVNILVLDRKTPKIREDFFYEPYQHLDSLLYKKYSISGWLDQILQIMASNSHSKSTCLEKR